MRAVLFVLFAIAMTGGAALAGGGGKPPYDPDAHARAELVQHGIDAPPSELAPLATELANATTIEPLVARAPFKMQVANGSLEGVPLPSDRARAALLLIRRELARYEPARLKAAGLRRIVLASDLRESGKLISSLPNVAGALLLDGSVPEAFLARLLHHEIFHFLDFADGERRSENEAWQTDNGSFAYGEGGRSVRSARASEISDEHPGFLTRYAMSAVEEDKAEVFSLLMTRPGEVRGRAERDGVVRAKVQRLRAKLHRLAPELAGVTSL